ncbi:hypothetical protein [Dactylosporangium sp. NPDC051484]|uniref:hypothetical protein n=1 Tax=Dactylosporangium sp. NPDC051484 TaxID=3154942 RepID=UPI00344F9180
MSVKARSVCGGNSEARADNGPLFSLRKRTSEHLGSLVAGGLDRAEGRGENDQSWSFSMRALLTTAAPDVRRASATAAITAAPAGVETNASPSGRCTVESA